VRCWNRLLLRVFLACNVFLLMLVHASAGSIFLTGHDPDYHAYAGFDNSLGAQHINQAAINFILDPAYNPFAASGIREFLYVEGAIVPPAGHADGANGLIASGYQPGLDFETHSASTLAAQLNLLGTKYSGLVIASNFGGILTQSELDVLNARNSDIVAFLNAGGGLFAMAETVPPDGLATNGLYGFLPFVVQSATPRQQTEIGNALTPFGADLGLSASDINGNFAHNVFASTGGLSVVDANAAGEIVSLAGRGQINANTGIIPEPRSIALLAAGMFATLFWRWALDRSSTRVDR
jgi:hypothetical protein